MKYQTTPSGPCMCGSTDCPSCGPAQDFPRESDYLDAAVNTLVAEKRELFSAVDDAVGSLSDESYLEQSRLIFEALKTEREGSFSPEALQAIGQLLCERVLERLDLDAREEVEDIFGQ